MGYGIFITDDQKVVVYANDLNHKNVLSSYWDKIDDRINEDLNNAEDMIEYVAIAIAILVACSEALISAGVNNLDELAA